jgi:magnesium-transporting ATPase (P-type)
MWLYIDAFLENNFPNLAPKIRNNMLSTAHAIVAICLLYFQFITILSILSVRYYLYDLKNYDKNKDQMMILHHIGSCAAIFWAYLFEEHIIFAAAFMALEISNIPLYITYFIIYGPGKSSPFFKWGILAEFVAYLILRIYYLSGFIFRAETVIFQMLLLAIYIGGIMWTLKFAAQTLHEFCGKERDIKDKKAIDGANKPRTCN